MKKKKIPKEDDLVWLDRLTENEQTKATGGKIQPQITGTIRIYF